MAERKGVDFWKEQIKKWESSGLTNSDYCRLNNLNLRNFYNRKIKISGQEKLSKSDFLKIELGGAIEATEIEFVFKEDFKFKLKPRFDKKLLAEILDTIGGVLK
ncbi:MAG TPA: hypothetical protein PLO89_09080 [Spirochaetota bacterium]|nr:hypothetical protein [Spirochaetota bacterium]